MITVNRIRQGLRGVRINVEFRLAIAKANRVKARTLRIYNPGYDELRHPLFLGVMAVAAVVLVLDLSDTWGVLGAFLVALGSFVQQGV